MNNEFYRYENVLYLEIDSDFRLQATAGGVIQSPINLDLRHLAQSALARLLSRSASSVDVRRPLSCHTPDAVQLLPLVVGCLDAYVKRASDGDKPDVNTGDEASRVDVRLNAALDVLQCLVSYSEDVRMCLLTEDDVVTSGTSLPAPVGPSGDATQVINYSRLRVI